jgi:hypothetical protein
MHELKRVEPRRLARVLAVVYGGLFTLFTLISVPMLMLMPVQHTGGNAPHKALLLMMLVFYPLMGAGFGWISGYVVSRIYNLVARRFGGILIQVARVAEHPSTESIT